MRTIIAEEYLTPAEAAAFLKATRNTVYRWCREGSLPAIKVGGTWRIPRSALEGRRRAGVVASGELTWADVLDRLTDETSSHWLVITDTPDEVYDVDASFISRGLATGRRVVKGSWWQETDEVRRELSRRGIDVEAAERSGALVLMHMGEWYARGGIDAVVERWQEMADGAARLGFRGLWKTGSPTLDDRAPYDGVMEVEEAACTFFHEAGAHAICPIYTAAHHPEWHARLTRMLARHDAVIYRSAERSAFLRLAS